MLRNDKGFTFLEIIVALTVLATAILALVQLLSGGMNQATQADRYLTGVYLAQQKLAELELDNFPAESQQGEFSESGDYQWQLTVAPYDSPTNDAGANIQVQKIAMRVFWQDNGQEKEIELVTLNTKGETHAAPVSQLFATGQKTNPQPGKPAPPKNTQPPRSP